MTNFCMQCGAKLEDKATACSACGNPVPLTSNFINKKLVDDVKNKLQNFSSQLHVAAAKAADDIAQEAKKINENKSKNSDLKNDENRDENKSELTWLKLAGIVLIIAAYYLFFYVMPIMIVSIVTPSYLMPVLKILLGFASIYCVLVLISVFMVYFKKSKPIPFTRIANTLTYNLFEKYKLFNFYKFKFPLFKNNDSGKINYSKPSILNLLIILSTIIIFNIFSTGESDFLSKNTNSPNRIPLAETKSSPRICGEHQKNKEAQYSKCSSDHDSRVNACKEKAQYGEDPGCFDRMNGAQLINECQERVRQIPSPVC